MRILNIKHENGNYNIYIGKDVLSELGHYLKENFNNKRVAVITDSNIEGLYGNILSKTISENGCMTKTIAFKPGEESKSFSTLQEIYKGLSDFKIKREDIIITFGGGVVGDLGGFAASTYLRGIKYIQIPTSLLAQVDSSIGGKVAVDLPWGKNLVGSFYHPAAVFIDPKFLQTLSKRFLHDGLAEVIKYGCISDRSIIDKLLTYRDDDELLEHIEEIIYTCCNIKRFVVEIDEKDFGERMLLNFGHTLGHALERHFEYKRYTHGEAVAIGMAHISMKSESMGITQERTSKLIEEVLRKYGLPYEMPEVKREDILEAALLDKKSYSGGINLILLEKIGKAFIKKVSIDDLKCYI